MVPIPFLSANPPPLSEAVDELRHIEASGIYSNHGPVSRRFEQAMVERVFGGVGACLAVGNATLGLMLAIRYAMDSASPRRGGRRRFALMPSFTFAATGHAAVWNGLTPLFCDIDKDTWMPSHAAEQALLEQFADDIAVIVPYATFGGLLDLEHYAGLERRYGIPVVIDAAASLGTQTADGRGFAAGTALISVFSLHATKVFATSEGGLIYTADAAKIDTLRSMSNFGFDERRVATLPGLNAKMDEITALLGLRQLDRFEASLCSRVGAVAAYTAALPDLQVQRFEGLRQAHVFMPMLLPARCAAHRPGILAHLAAAGIGARTYFSPHLAEHPYFQVTAQAGELTTTADIAARIVSLPVSDRLTPEQVRAVCAVLREVCG